MNRDEILDMAGDYINAARDEMYGDPAVNHQRIADLWSAILDVDVEPEEVVLCMIAVKMSRLCNTRHHNDSWVDIAGYAALGGEIAHED